MARYRNLVLVGLLAALPILLASVKSDAGTQTESAFCQKNADGSGSCYGTFLGFRQSADANAGAYFYYNSPSAYGFYGNVNGTYVSCVASYPLQGMWHMALAHKGYFYVTWDASATCQNLLLSNDSASANF